MAGALGYVTCPHCGAALPIKARTVTVTDDTLVVTLATGYCKAHPITAHVVQAIAEEAQGDTE